MRPPAMHLSIPKRRQSIVLSIALLLALAACAGGTAFQPAATDEIKPGPGLFTGEAGRFVISRRRADD